MLAVVIDVRLDFARVSHRPRLPIEVKRQRKAERSRRWQQANRPRLAALARQYRNRRKLKNK
jgi:hypothetical protein